MISLKSSLCRKKVIIRVGFCAGTRLVNPRPLSSARQRDEMMRPSAKGSLENVSSVASAGETPSPQTPPSHVHLENH